MMKKFFKNQKGQGIMGYVIISSLVGICCLAAMSRFGKTVQGKIDDLKENINSTIKIDAKN